MRMLHMICFLLYGLRRFLKASGNAMHFHTTIFVQSQVHVVGELTCLPLCDLIILRTNSLQRSAARVCQKHMSSSPAKFGSSRPQACAAIPKSALANPVAVTKSHTFKDPGNLC